MLDGGFIKLHRKMIKWEWYQDANTFRVFVHLLLTANYERRRFEGMVIERGQRVTSIAKLSKELKVSVKAVRVALNHLQETNEVTCQGTPKFTVITVNNYDFYQKVDSDEQTMNRQLNGENTASPAANATASPDCDFTRLYSGKSLSYDSRGASTTASPAANERQTKGKLRANEGQQWKKDKESKRKIKKRERGALSPHGQFLNVFLSDAEVADLAEKYPHDYERKIERLSRYIESNGKDYPNHYIKLMDWLEEDVGVPGRSKDVRTKSSYDIDELEEINRLDYVE